MFRSQVAREVLDVSFIGSSDRSVGFWALLSTAGVCDL